MAYVSQSYTFITGTKNASGDNTVITGAADRQIVIKDMVIQNESSTESTILIKNGSTTIWRAVLEGKKAMSFSFVAGEELVLDAGSSLVLNLSGALSHGYNIRYYVK